jgi:hypothetical protein
MRSSRIGSVLLGSVLCFLMPSRAVGEPGTCAHGSCGSKARQSRDASVLLRDGPCGVGFYGSGNYCISYGGSRALPKSGPCPSGTFPSGRYCVFYK